MVLTLFGTFDVNENSLTTDAPVFVAKTGNVNSNVGAPATFT